MGDDFELEESIEEENVPAPKSKKAKAAKKPAKPKAKKRELDEFGLAAGSVRSRAAALYARREGATLKEVCDVVGVIQFNVLTKLKKDGFKITTANEAGEKNRTITRYFLHRK